LHQISTEIADGHLVPLNVALTGNARSIGLTYRTSWRPTATQARFLELLRQSSPAETGRKIPAS